ncbi:SGNH/GDSL hydrolase family protein [Psychromonas sp. SP041]|uniref:SGNH/GDSL hydrolase family protein n=1 Tax=Psychromonas sp. SP041 TaxID=1365007 RepID=UPI0023EF4CC7|nr:SGNH/GDSL hydrolase family protein [Psychromonas sp. SP041]
MRPLKIKKETITLLNNDSIRTQLDLDIHHLVVFGDSMSDNGFENGHGFQRYSNGKVWAEYLAKKMDLTTLDVRAWGGATSGKGNYRSNARDWSGLLWQTEQYTPATNMDNTLVVVEIGYNDLHDPDINISAIQVMENVIEGLKQLFSKGVKHILLWNLNTTLVFPGYTDKNYQSFNYYQNKNETAQSTFKEYNQLINLAIHELNQKYQTITIDLFDANLAINEISKKFENITTPWIETGKYPKIGQWFWFDHWHYMTEAHSKIADYLYKYLSPTNNSFHNKP